MMSSTSNFRTILETQLEIDTESGATRDDPEVSRVVADQEIRLLMRENRIGVAVGKVSRTAGKDGTVGIDVPMIVTVHSHPECRFRWSRLTVDLSPTPGARIGDLSPIEIRGDKPVEIKTSVSVGLKFETAPKVLSAEVKPEIAQSRTVYYPDIVASGVGTRKAIWDFLALSSDYLHANRELRALVTAREDVELRVRFGLRARVQMQGLAGLIPLLAAKGTIDKIYLLS